MDTRQPAPPGSSETDPEDEWMAEEEMRECIRQYEILINPTQEDMIITFVDGLEKAHQYFEFEDYLKNKCDFIKLDNTRHHIFKILIHQQERKIRFYKLDEALIMNAIQAHISGLDYAEILEQRSKSRPIDIPYSEEYCDTLNHKFDSWRLKSELCPLFKLVYEARKGCYFLQENPKAEIDKIMKSHPSFYDGGYVMDTLWIQHHNRRHSDMWWMYMASIQQILYQDFFIMPKVRVKLNFSERKVKLAYLPDDCTEEDVRKLLSDCGEIEDIKLGSSEEEKYAHVTFKNSDSVKIAPFIVRGFNAPLILGVHEDDSAVVEAEDLGIRFTKAMTTYRQLHLRYSEPPPPAERDKRSKSPATSPSRSVRPRITSECY